VARPGTIQKGEVRNPGGARKKNPIVTDLAAKEAPDAFRGLVELSKTHPDARIRLDAYKYIIDRNMGKPHQAVEHSGEVNLPITFVIGTKQITPAEK
jgi:hypothetical protein